MSQKLKEIRQSGKIVGLSVQRLILGVFLHKIENRGNFSLKIVGIFH